MIFLLILWLLLGAVVALAFGRFVRAGGGR